MKEEIFEIATNIKTPLSLAGLFAAILFFILKLILTKKNTQWKINTNIIILIINRIFILALIAMFLGVSAYGFVRYYSTNENRTFKVVALTFNIRDKNDNSPLDSVSVIVMNVDGHISSISDEKGLVNILFENYKKLDSISLGFSCTKFGISSYPKEKISINTNPPDYYFEVKRKIEFSPVNKAKPIDSLKTIIENKNVDFAMRIKSMLYKVSFNSNISDVLTFELGKAYSNVMAYEKLPIAAECSNDTIRYYWRYLNQSPIGREVYSFLNSKGLNNQISNDSYVVYGFKNNKLIRISLRIIPFTTDFDNQFTASLIEGTSLKQFKYNKTKVGGYYYIMGSSFTDFPYTEILMSNEVGYNSCIHDWWHN